MQPEYCWPVLCHKDVLLAHGLLTVQTVLLHKAFFQFVSSVCSYLGLFLLKCSILHLLLFNFMWYLLPQFSATFCPILQAVNEDTRLILQVFNEALVAILRYTTNDSITCLQVDIVPLMKNFWTLFFRWLSIHFTIYPSNLYFVSLSTKIIGDHVKGFAKAEVGIHCSPLIHLVSHIIVESNVFGQAKFSFHKSIKTISLTFWSSMCLEMMSRKISTFTLPDIELKPVGL